MYKCKTEKCNYTIKDIIICNVGDLDTVCPKCGNKLVYINELQIKIDKYKKSMFLGKNKDRV